MPRGMCPNEPTLTVSCAGYLLGPRHWFPSTIHTKSPGKCGFEKKLSAFVWWRNLQHETLKEIKIVV